MQACPESRGGLSHRRALGKGRKSVVGVPAGRPREESPHGRQVASQRKGRWLACRGTELNFKHLTRGRESAETRMSKVGPGIKSKFIARRPGQEVNRNWVRRKNLDFILRSPGAAGSGVGVQGQWAPGACAWLPVCPSPLAPWEGRGGLSPHFLCPCTAPTLGASRYGASLPTHLWVLCPSPEVLQVWSSAFPPPPP